MLSKILSGGVVGIEGIPVTVEVDITKKGFGSFKIVGLAGKAVDESRERVFAALENTGIEFPKYRVTVNLAPADIPKDGPTYDLPIAIGILQASEKLPNKLDLSNAMFFGEVSLDGTLNATPAILPLTLLAKSHNIPNVYVPAINAKEAAIVDGINVYPVADIQSLVLHLTGEKLLEIATENTRDVYPTNKNQQDEIKLEDIKGQDYAKRALIIAAAGGHNIIFSGPPGAGKTMLARVLPSLMPPLTKDESISVTQIYSIAHLLDPHTPLMHERPFRAPHHTTSRVGLVGGGTQLSPGEITLAHRGVLFLDEIPEFPRSVTESLRQVMEDRTVTITRAKGSVTFPASFMMIAANNPCPCGYSGSDQTCTCTQTQILNYKKRLSGPLLDRIDIHSFVTAIDPTIILRGNRSVLDNGNQNTNEESKDNITTDSARKTIVSARNMQNQRFSDHNINTNAEMNAPLVQQYCTLTNELEEIMISASKKLGLSARSMHKTLKVARTIADLEQSEHIHRTHLLEAIGYRKKSNS
ncbi:magnesium chelatase [candidate division WWE3 bacterium CG22_combo_CG10-13_8_21_14_all_39_12]|uniref:Magnesium chelatase n=2 Tax=Katanobacteria TaxID=422282 RepID=A0A2M7X4P3_UNCKA|nr:MAG: magnesium chelatase [candidate division WWE3 bacterium CG22_combo_CG10-13_8_21_14_all_39_12]PJA41145.1 MAG: magnesium chelatase [candidate division WWE3 bacterium CG_4_9_14_3_um_filter_39_7]